MDRTTMWVVIIIVVLLLIAASLWWYSNSTNIPITLPPPVPTGTAPVPGY